MELGEVSELFWTPQGLSSAGRIRRLLVVAEDDPSPRRSVMKRLFANKIIATSVLLLVPIMSQSLNTLSAQNSHRFNAGSLAGDYSVLNHYGANLALGIGTVHFDGNGQLRGTLLLNRPTTSGTRELVSLTSSGTYTVNEDGTGTIVLAVTLPDGTIKTATEDFVITNTFLIWGRALAMGIEAEQREQSLVLGNGVFVTQTYTRRGE
jgi:hypothetical protein